MIIPLRTDRPPRHASVITPVIIGLNVIVFAVLQFALRSGTIDVKGILGDFHFNPQHFSIWNLISYQFLHDLGSPWHVLFNMLFLWIFGAPVEDRLGRLGFAVFYLVGGVVAGLGHMIVSSVPIIGASGSVAACTGAFLALYPRSRIVLLFLIGGGTVALPSLWFIGAYFALDVLRQTASLMGARRDVAYMAHIAGYVYGFGVGFVLLATGILKREEFDIFFLFTQMRRRAAMRVANRNSVAGAWTSASSDTAKRLTARSPTTATAEQTREIALRSQISARLSAHDLNAAAALYRDLLQQFPTSVFGEARQLELANQLYALNHFHDAARAYELFLDRFSNSHEAPQVQLMLAVIASRNLHQPQRAAELAAQARPKLRHADQQSLADELMAAAKIGHDQSRAPEGSQR